MRVSTVRELDRLSVYARGGLAEGSGALSSWGNSSMQQEMAPGRSLDAIGFEPTTPPEMLRLVDLFDWASTPLGQSATWPDSLKAVVRILLTSRFPMWMAWGPELTFLYNDAYRRTTLGKKHPWALGKPAAQVWHEIWKDIGPRIHQVMETGEASWDET